MTHPQDTNHANPAQVTDALIQAKDWISDNIREGDIAGCTLLGKLAELTAAIGAGGQEVAVGDWDIETTADQIARELAAEVKSFGPTGRIHGEAYNAAKAGAIAAFRCAVATLSKPVQVTDAMVLAYKQAFQAHIDVAVSPVGTEGAATLVFDATRAGLEAILSAIAHPAPSGQAVAVKPLDLSDLLKHAFSAGYVSAAGDDGWTDYDPTKCAAYSRILSAFAHPVQPGWRDGIALIAAERRRQIEKEGWTSEHDAEHTNGELAIAAACYALHAADNVDFHAGIDFWPWSDDWWKPSGDPIRDLEKAGALIAAEIDRLKRPIDRAGIAAPQPKGE